ncbi:hypothetical protein BKA62DRAFT_694598 [Auriculariales sp. MPI-PUGE-AT-0066]|nr:hypothetical protein BKA62DRAFT_694598 [Auriculariales sp. MPI-PUGE-AT-0066]
MTASGNTSTDKGNPSTQYAMLLHNQLQRNGYLNALRWDDTPNGVRHAPAWLSIVYINEIEYGRSVSLSKQTARNDAARQALQSLGWKV